MNICFITDLHTGAQDDRPFGIDLRQNFLDVIEAVSDFELDIIIIGGDLCLKAHSDVVCKWQKVHFDALEIPYFIIAGNHDDSVRLQLIFDDLPSPIEGELYYRRIIDHKHFIFLDTSKGIMANGQKEWLRQQLASTHSDPIVVMHHPPMLMGVPHMDHNHAFRDRDEVLDILLSCTRNIDVFCGHYHVEKMVRLHNLTIHITPSCYFQIDPFEKEFAVDHTRIGFRILSFEAEEQKFESQVRYLPGNVSQTD